MFRIAENTELYLSSSKKTAIAIKRSTGQILEFEIDSDGNRVIQALKNGSGKITNSLLFPEDLTILEQLAELGILTKRPEADLNHPFRSQLQWFECIGLDPEEAQKKLTSAKVGIVGLGATGAWVSLQLAMMGVSQFSFIDPDRVEKSNLVRQPYSPQHIGELKTKALSAILRNLRTDIKITHRESLILFTYRFILGLSDSS